MHYLRQIYGNNVDVSPFPFLSFQELNFLILHSPKPQFLSHLSLSLTSLKINIINHPQDHRKWFWPMTRKKPTYPLCELSFEMVKLAISNRIDLRLIATVFSFCFFGFSFCFLYVEFLTDYTQDRPQKLPQFDWSMWSVSIWGMEKRKSKIDTCDAKFVVRESCWKLAAIFKL